MNRGWVLAAVALLACHQQEVDPPAALQDLEHNHSVRTQVRGKRITTGTEVGGEQDTVRQASRGGTVGVDAVLASAADYVGQAVEGTANVDEVISDRGFWLGSGSERLLAVVREDVPRHEMIDIDAGQRLEFTGVVLSPSAVDDLAGVLEQATRQAIAQQPAFLAVYWKDITLID